MTNEQSHTPTPWAVVPMESGGFKIVVKNDPAFTICRIEKSITYLMAFDPAAKPDAELITLAVNNHAPLVNALRNARNYIDGVIANSPDPRKRRNFGECLRIIEDALKPVGGNSFPHDNAAE